MRRMIPALRSGNHHLKNCEEAEIFEWNIQVRGARPMKKTSCFPDELLIFFKAIMAWLGFS